MQCSQCGYMMSEFDEECPRCKRGGVQSASQERAALRQAATPSDIGKLKQQMLLQDKFDLVAGEQILVEGLTTYIKSALKCISCNGYVTNHRLVFCDKSMIGAQALFGVIGTAAALMRKSVKITVQVPVSEISSIVKGKHGFAAKYTVHTKSGESYNLQFSDKWETTISALGVKITT